MLVGLLEAAGFEVKLDDRNAAHGRVLTLHFAQNHAVRIILDQGFGPWRTPSFARFDFGAEVTKQLSKLAQFNAIVTARGAGYIVIT